MKRGFYTVMAAQFFSSLADNALLIAAIQLLVEMHAPEWIKPLLKLFFTISYVALAPFVAIPLVAASLLVSRLISTPSRRRYPPAEPTWHRTIDTDYTVVEREVHITSQGERSADADLKPSKPAAPRRQPGDTPPL